MGCGACCLFASRTLECRSSRHHEEPQHCGTAHHTGRRDHPGLAAQPAVARTADTTRHARRPLAQLHRPEDAGEYLAAGRLQRHARHVCRRLEDGRLLPRHSLHDDRRGVWQVDGEEAAARLLPLEEFGDPPGTGQGEILVHRHALRPRSGREDLRPRRRTHQDAGDGRAEVRCHDEEHRQPLTPHPQP